MICFSIVKLYLPQYCFIVLQVSSFEHGKGIIILCRSRARLRPDYPMLVVKEVNLIPFTQVEAVATWHRYSHPPLWVVNFRGPEGLQGLSINT